MRSEGVQDPIERGATTRGSSTKLKRALRLLPRLWRPAVSSLRIVPAYLVSAGLQGLTARQILELLDWRNSPVLSTPVLSYVDWAGRNRASGLLDDYPRSPDYEWVRRHQNRMDRLHTLAAFLRATRRVPGDLAE